MILGQIITGSTPPTKKTEYYGDEYPGSTPTDIKIDSRIVQTQRFLSQKGFEYNAQIACSLAMLFDDKSALQASANFCSMTTVSSVTNQHFHSEVLDQQNFDPYFVYYQRSTKADMLHNVAGGVATPIVKKSEICKSWGVCSASRNPTQNRRCPFCLRRPHRK